MSLEYLKQKLEQTHAIQWQVAAQFFVYITAVPFPFHLYAKEISFTPIEIETDQFKVGSRIFTLPNGTQPVEISMTVKEDEAGTCWNYFHQWSKQVAQASGTFQVLTKMRREIVIATLKEDGTKTGVVGHYSVYPTRVGELSLSVESSNQLLEFPVTLIET